MTVTLNQVALEALLDSEDGPVGQEVQHRAEQVVAQAQENIRIIMADSFIDPSSAVGFVMEGSTARIGIRDEGRVTRYLDAKAAREVDVPGDWMRRALRAVFG